MKRKTIFLLAVGGLMALPALAAIDGMISAAPSDALWHATVRVESGANPRAYNRHDGASGIAQIRGVCLNDVNRIARQRGLGARFTPSDLYDPVQARRIWELYLDYYGDAYQKQTGRRPTDEIYARIWNGGPNGWRKASTLEYWDRVRSAMQ
jgi:soluble lytic murein transglycosylase-like protein